MILLLILAGCSAAIGAWLHFTSRSGVYFIDNADLIQVLKKQEKKP
jgi:hypothetical protein